MNKNDDLSLKVSHAMDLLEGVFNEDKIGVILIAFPYLEVGEQTIMTSMQISSNGGSKSEVAKVLDAAQKHFSETKTLIMKKGNS